MALPVSSLRPVKDARRMAGDDSGSIALIFALIVTTLTLAAGVALDYARAARVASMIGATVDAAALAAAKALSQGASAREVERQALTYIDANLKAAKLGGAALSGVRVVEDRARNTLTVTAGAEVETAFMRIAGIDTVPVRKSAAAAFNVKDIELSMVLDITGSMSGRKLRDLQDAASEAVNTLMDTADQSGSNIRIGLVPYAASVNVGAMAGMVTAAASRDGCVIERSGRHQGDDAAPGAGAWFGAYPDAGVPRNSRYSCPGSELVPLTGDRRRLLQTIAGFRAEGWTAGHIGAAWGWYQVSPQWAAVWPAGSVPQPYDASGLVKAVVLMSDGEFNTSYLNGGSNRTSDIQARAVCDAIKAKGVTIFALGFRLEEPAAVATMEHCASTGSDGTRQLYLAASGAELSEAFRDITGHLLQLRLAR